MSEIIKIYNGYITKNEYEEIYNRFGKKEIDRWQNEIKMEDLWQCVDAFASDSLLDNWNLMHREKRLNALEMILQEEYGYLTDCKTYGSCPNATCEWAIGYITHRTYLNFDIARFLIQTNIYKLKDWLLKEYKFSDKEKRLLHYFKENKE